MTKRSKSVERKSREDEKSKESKAGEKGKWKRNGGRGRIVEGGSDKERRMEKGIS